MYWYALFTMYRAVMWHTLFSLYIELSGVGYDVRSINRGLEPATTVLVYTHC